MELLNIPEPMCNVTAYADCYNCKPFVQTNKGEHELNHIANYRLEQTVQFKAFFHADYQTIAKMGQNG